VWAEAEIGKVTAVGAPSTVPSPLGCAADLVLSSSFLYALWYMLASCECIDS
jgi:hypothetical protein